MELYSIYDGDREIGQAQVSREGMFLRIRCVCRTSSGVPQRLCAKWNGGSMPLGLCIPEGNQMTLLKRIPRNKLDESSLTFSTVSMEVDAVLIMPDRPLEKLSMLKQARLVLRDGKHYLFFLDQSSSKPTGQ